MDFYAISASSKSTEWKFFCEIPKIVLTLRINYKTFLIMRGKILFLVASFAIILTSCGHVLTEEEAKSAVLSGEQENLPLLVQKFSDVESIVIDSIYIRIKDEPMSGFIYTTWKYIVEKTVFPTANEMMKGIYETKEIKEEKIKQLIVPVYNIQQSKERKGYIEWQSDWDEAYQAIIEDKY